MRHLLFSVWAVGLCVSVAGAQPATRKEPAQYTATEPAFRVEARPPGLRLGLRKPHEFALAPLSGSEAAALAEPGPRLKLGVHRNLPVDALSTGAWEVTSEGTRVWRLSLHSPGSRGIRVEFQNFAVGSGKVWIHDDTQVAGPYTDRGVFGDGHFWSDSVFSESVIVEFEPAPGTTPDAALPFEVRTIAHQARAALRDGSPSAGTADPADTCHKDPSCYTDWKPAMSMVAKLTFEDGGLEYLCSGSLISTRDNSFKPYLLTAGHCINNEDAARTLEAYWTYQTTSCSGAAPVLANSTKSTLGAHLIDYGSIDAGDYSLVLLKDVPSGVTFSGWDITDPAVLTEVAGVHHPVGSWKRISFGQRVPDVTVDVEGNAAPGDKYLQVLWDQGRTEPGSSGSPLFTSPGVIVGTLTYGPFSPQLTACEIQPSIDGYGRFSNTYQYLKAYLENLPAATVTPDKTALQFTLTNRTASAAQAVKLSTQGSGQATYRLRADAQWIQVSSVTGTLSSTTPATVSISIDPTQFSQPGSYAGTVTVLAGTADPQFINVSVTVTQAQSNVTASISPNPVVQSGNQWSFKITLAETAGTGTQLTAVKLNGTDYSSSIQSWFGTDHIAAKGTIEAPLTGSGLFPAGTQFFEFWGIDDGSGKHWYRSVPVIFQ